MANAHTITLNVEQAARQFGVNRETLRQNLRAHGHETDKGKKYTLREIYRALSGDLKAERTRKTRAEADLLELERQQTEKELVALSEAEELIRRFLGPVREKFLSLPDSMCARVNPHDPELARGQLLEWVEDAMKAARGK